MLRTIWMKAVILGLLLLVPSPAAATLVFDWTGTCLTGCTGQATFHVVTTNTFPTDTHTGPPGDQGLLEAIYHDSVTTQAGLATSWNRNGIDLFLPSEPSGFGVFSLEDFGFRSQANGTWRLAAAIPCVDDRFCTYLATGTDGLWLERPAAVVPWPGAWLLLGLGLFLLYMHAHRVARARRRLHDDGILAWLH